MNKKKKKKTIQRPLFIDSLVSQLYELVPVKFGEKQQLINKSVYDTEHNSHGLHWVKSLMTTTTYALKSICQ